MCRNYAESGCRLQAAGYSLMLLLAACGSTPSQPQERPVPVAAASGSVATSRPPATPAPAPAVSKPAKAAKDSQDAPADIAPAEAPLPPEAVQQFERAVTLMGAGDTAAAEQAFRSLAEAYPAYSGALLNLGILQAKAGRLDDAEKTLRSAAERNANSAPVFNQLGIVYRRQGRFAEADAAYQQAVKIAPDYALAWLNLGVLCDLYLQQPQRALEAFEKYLSLAPVPDQKVTGWVTELKARLGNQARSARTE